MNIKASIAMLVGALALASNVDAGPIPYPTPVTANPVTYTFTASSTGNITAYFYGSTAAYTNDLTMLVNGVLSGVEDSTITLRSMVKA